MTAATTRPFESVADALGAGEHVEALAVLFEDWAAGGFSVPELVALAADLATSRLPRGMSLTDARPGCWESACFEPMINPESVEIGAGPGPLDVECPTCSADPGARCWNVRTYADTKRPHPARITAAKSATWAGTGLGWVNW
jgi:hypothetical protein